MKKFLFWLIGWVLSFFFLGVEGVSAQYPEPFRILFIGNSFSQDTTEYLWDIANSAGVPIEVGNLSIGGGDLQTHWNNASGNTAAYIYYKWDESGSKTTQSLATLLSGILDEERNAIALQQVSRTSGLSGTYEPFLSSLIDYIQSNAPTAEIVWHMTRAYASNSSHSSFPNYNNDQITMYNAILDTVQTMVVTPYDLKVIPNTTTIQNARASTYLGEVGNELTRDGYHLDLNMGRRLSALTVFWKLIAPAVNSSLDEVSFYPSGVSEKFWILGKASVQAALSTPYSISDMTEADEEYATPKLGTSLFTFSSNETEAGYYSLEWGVLVEAENNSNQSFIRLRRLLYPTGFLLSDFQIGDVIFATENIEFRPVMRRISNGLWYREEYQQIFEFTWGVFDQYNALTLNMRKIWVTSSALVTPDYIEEVSSGVSFLGTKITGAMSYSTTEDTTGSVVATLTLNRQWTITNNEGNSEYTFTGNGNFVFEFEDAFGNTGNTIAAVHRILDDCEIDYSASRYDGTCGTAPTNPAPPSGWWSGGWSNSKDNCPDGDYSLGYYDGECGEDSGVETDTTTETLGSSEEWVGDTTKDGENTPSVDSSQAQNDTDDEVLSAYTRAYAHDITTLAPIANATPEGEVIRGHMAKMVVNYALNVLWWTLPEKVPSSCNWKDGGNARESEEIKNYAIKACSLGLMGIDIDYFQPNKVVTRAQFGTILSRLLWQTTYAGGTPYYAKHLAALKEHGIMTQIDTPEQRNELRQRVWLMLMRSQDN